MMINLRAMGLLSSSKSRPPIRAWLPYFVLAVSLLLTVVVAQYVAVTAEAKDQLRFQTDAQ
ncbi:MAG TPA: hypothetical protein VFQ92_11270, partial [Blastocatellia bacterium]|nr:hypothetical protein [Blastocatellia bacterium]